MKWCKTIRTFNEDGLIRYEILLSVAAKALSPAGVAELVLRGSREYCVILCVLGFCRIKQHLKYILTCAFWFL